MPRKPRLKNIFKSFIIVFALLAGLICCSSSCSSQDSSDTNISYDMELEITDNNGNKTMFTGTVNGTIDDASSINGNTTDVLTENIDLDCIKWTILFLSILSVIVVFYFCFGYDNDHLLSLKISLFLLFFLLFLFFCIDKNFNILLADIFSVLYSLPVLISIGSNNYNKLTDYNGFFSEHISVWIENRPWLPDYLKHISTIFLFFSLFALGGENSIEKAHSYIVVIAVTFALCELQWSKVSNPKRKENIS